MPDGVPTAYLPGKPPGLQLPIPDVGVLAARHSGSIPASWPRVRGLADSPADLAGLNASSQGPASEGAVLLSDT